MRHFLSRNLKRLLLSSLILQCICAFVFAYSFYQQQRESNDVIRQFADDCVRKITKEMLWNHICMGQMTVDTSDYRTMFSQKDFEVVKRISELHRIFQVLQEASINHYNFFIYDGKQNRFLEITPVAVPFERYQTIKATLLAEAQSVEPKTTWNLISLEKERIIYCMWIYDGFVMGSWIEEEAFLTYLQGLDLQQKGGIFLLLKEAEEQNNTYPYPGQLILDYDLTECNTNFLIRIITSQSQEATQRMIMQLVPILISFPLAILILLLFLHIRKNLIVPMKNLSDILDKYKSDTTLQTASVSTQPEPDHSSISHPPLEASVPIKEVFRHNKQDELTDAYMILEQLGQRVETLSAELYQKELQTKQLQLNFRTLQIRPHFFVNCLAMISGMAQVNDLEKIREMTVYLSDYYRYVLRDCMDLVTLRQEIEHMDHVIQIYSEWSSTQFLFEKDIADEVLDATLPVLSIGTFLENSIKHAVPIENRLRILITACRKHTEQGSYLYIRISDDGVGMPEDLVAQLNQQSPVAETEGRHIGINNVIQRLHLLYDDRASLHFTSSTAQNSGTCVEICIPEG